MGSADNAGFSAKSPTHVLSLTTMECESSHSYPLHIVGIADPYSQVRFLNSQVQGNNINSEQAALGLIQQVKFSGKLLGTGTNSTTQLTHQV